MIGPEPGVTSLCILAFMAHGHGPGDGVYGIQLQVLVRPEAGSGRYVGSNPGILVVWQATRHLQIQGAVTRFLSGAFLKNSFLAGGFGFYSATARYRF